MIRRQHLRQPPRVVDQAQGPGPAEGWV